MNQLVFNPKELTKEKNLWDIYISSRKIPPSNFNFISTICVVILLVVSVWVGKSDIRNTIETVRKLSEIGLGVSLSTLGFLIAGFTIFATVSQPQLLVSMAKIINEKSGLSWLKHNFFIFVRVFIYYIAFTAFCLIVLIFGHKKGLASILANLSPDPEKTVFYIVNVSYVILLSGYYFLLVQLKSFVFNIYHAVMTSIRWNAEGYGKD